MFAKVAPALVLPLFIAVWILAIALLALFGGWRSLASVHAAPEGFEVDSASRFSFRSIQLRHGRLVRTRYGGTMTVGLTPQGLYLVRQPVLRLYGAVSDAAWGEWRSRVRPSGSTRAQ